MSPGRLLPLSVMVGAGCLGDATSEPAQPVTIEVIGDTTFVTSHGPGAWGTDARLEEELRIGRVDGEEWEVFGDIESIAAARDGSIFVVDRQVPALRQFGADGTYLRTFGGEGEGPGEYRRPDGGLGVLSDGRVVVRDPGNARFQLYGPSGEALGTLRYPGNVISSSQLVVGPEDRIYTQSWVDPGNGSVNQEMGLVGYDVESGLPVDTIPPRTWVFEPPRLWAYNDAGLPLTMAPLPFSPQPHWSLNRAGQEVSGFSSEYRIDIARGANDVLTIRNAVEEVAVSEAEAQNLRDRLTATMRRAVASWEWDGPPVPRTKPAFQGILTSLDGRTWVHAHLESRPIPASDVAVPEGPGAIPPLRWTEPVAFDVFETDGSLLGRVTAPDGFKVQPSPVLNGDVVWAVVEGEFGEDYVVRFRVVPPQEDSGG